MYLRRTEKHIVHGISGRNGKFLRCKQDTVRRNVVRLSRHQIAPDRYGHTANRIPHVVVIAVVLRNGRDPDTPDANQQYDSTSHRKQIIADMFSAAFFLEDK